MPNDNRLTKLISRLRELEVEALRLAEIEIASPEAEQVPIYRERLDRLENSHSHSWFGDHAATYYGDFQTPTNGRTFNVEWGFIPGYGGSRNPGWRVCSHDELKGFIFAEVGEAVALRIESTSQEILEQFSNVRDQVLAAAEAVATIAPSKALERYITAIQDQQPYRAVDYLNSRLASTPKMSRDSQEIAKGKNVPIHVQYLARLHLLDTNKGKARQLANVIRNVIETVSLSNDLNMTAAVQSNRVFIGHGRSEQWRVLKDFLKDRLNLPFEEFNRVSPAGISTQERLSEMLFGCNFAFLVLTAEDFHKDESVHARENVIHEAGLFQGRLGWRKAIVLLEDGCEEFSNIFGLGQIRFAKGNISTCFEQVRQVLEREGLLPA